MRFKFDYENNSNITRVCRIIRIFRKNKYFSVDNFILFTYSSIIFYLYNFLTRKMNEECYKK